MRSFTPSELTIPQTHGLILGAVGPRPIAFASTLDAQGTPNLAPFSFFNAFGSNPPMLIFSPARRVRNNTTKHTYENIKQHREVVINIVDYSMVHQVSLASTEYPEGVNEFEKAGFTALPSDIVKPFRVKESPAQYECLVRDVIEMGDGGGAASLILCEIVRIHIRADLLDENLNIDQERIDTVGRMGGNYYARAHGDALFQVTKPLRTHGIGVDQLPAEIRNSRILTGNDLGRLGNVEVLPDETSVNDFKLTELSDIFVEYEDAPEKLEEALHKRAHEYLEQGQVEQAWLALLSFNN